MYDRWLVRVIVGFSSALLLVGAITIVSYRSTTGLAETTAQVTHSHATITAFNALLSLLRDAQRATFGYILTGDRRHLEPYYAAVPGTQQQLEKLRRLTSENVTSQEHLQALQPLVTRALAEMKKVLDICTTQGAEVAAQYLQRGQTWKSTDEITRLIWDMEAAEMRTLTQREGAAERRTQRTISIVALGNVIVMVLVSVGIMTVSSELTARRHAEAESRRAKDAAEVANRAKGEFLAGMSHEIRTPLNAIIGMGDLLSETPLSLEQREYVRITRTAGDTLLSVVNNILDFSKVEAGRVELEQVPFDLRELLESTCEVMAVRSHQKGLELCCLVPPTVPPLSVGDPARLRQILVNLLANAIKFTEQGEVVVEVQTLNLRPGRQHSYKLCFSVRDTGIGIATDKLSLIFDSFTQADSSTTRHYGGTGLGLAITKRLVELMGGHIWAESHLGTGSAFFFTIQLALQGDTQDPDSPSVLPLTGLRTLIIDDNATTRGIIAALVSPLGAETHQVATGKEGLVTLMQQQKEGTPYQLLLLDSDLPTEESFEIAHHCRKQPELKNLKLLMLVTAGRSHDIVRCQALGLRSVTKPVKRDSLLTAIHETLTDVPVQPLVSPLLSLPTPPIPQQPLHILLVDDDPYNRVVIQAYLQHTPYRITTAENGRVAVEKFTAARYGIVLMDIHMPHLDGLAAVQLMRAWEQEQQHASVPIIALTASVLKEEIQECLDAGFTAHVTKPVKKEVLIATLARYAGTVAAPEPEDTNTDSSVQVNVSQALRAIIPQYLQDQRGVATSILVALEQRDYHTIRELSHKMRGSGGSFGFDTLTTIGRSLEEAAQGKDQEQVRHWQYELSRYLDQVEVVYH